MLPRKLCHRGHALRGLVERNVLACGRYVGGHGAAEHHDAVRRAAFRIPFRKALFQRQHQRIADRRDADDHEQQNRADHEPLPKPAEARAHEQNASERQYDQKIGGQREEAENFRQPEHRYLSLVRTIARRYFFCRSAS